MRGLERQGARGVRGVVDADSEFVEFVTFEQERERLERNGMIDALRGVCQCLKCRQGRIDEARLRFARAACADAELHVLWSAMFQAVAECDDCRNKLIHCQCGGGE